MQYGRSRAFRPVAALLKQKAGISQAQQSQNVFFFSEPSSEVSERIAKSLEIPRLNGTVPQVHGSSHLDREHELDIQALCRKRELDKALDMAFRMHSPIHDNIYMSLLKACHQNTGLSHVKRVLALITKHRSPLPMLVSDYLVVTLAKCGALEDAWKVSSTLPRRTVFSWTALISAFVVHGRTKEAFRMRECMHADGVEPNSYTLVSLIKACGITRDLEQGKELHDEVRRKGLASDVFVGSTLVSMYGKCGAVMEAELVFSTLCQRNIVSWNAMLAAYVEQGQGEKALLLFRQMREDGVDLDRHTLSFTLQACLTLVEKFKSCLVDKRLNLQTILELTHALHADAMKLGFSSDVFVGSTFINIYGRLGSISEAVRVFCALSVYNVVSWTAMLSVYVTLAQAEKALQLYWQMQKDGINPDRFAATAALKACCSLVEKSDGIRSTRSKKTIALEIGEAIYADACMNMTSSDVFLDCCLLNMYSKCGATIEAEKKFAALSQPSAVLWSAMLALFVERDEGEKALQFYRNMQEEAVDLDGQIVVCALQAVCCLTEIEEPSFVAGQFIKVRCFEIGRGLHADVRRKGLTSDVFVCNTLVNMYGKCGAIVEAEHAFSALLTRNVVTWTVMLSAYHDHGHGIKALQLYVRMQHEGVQPDRLAYTIVIQACGFISEMENSHVLMNASCKLIALEIGQSIHDDIRKKGFGSDAFIGTAILSMYGKCAAISEAEKVFETMAEHDVVTWSAMLSAYLDQNQGQKALQLYRQMHEERLFLDELVHMFAFQACSILADSDEMMTMERPRKVSALEIGRALHSDARRKGFAGDLCVSNTILNMYGKCGAILEAEHVFAAASERNTVSWNAMITVYTEQSEEEKALLLFKEMQNSRINVDDITLISVLKACSTTGSLDICNQLHFDIICVSYESISSVAVSLIHAYGSCARIMDAHALFDELTEPSLASWNACITGHAEEGYCTESLQMLEKLKLEAIKPDEVTFTSAISACSHAGLVFEGLAYFTLMTQDYGIAPAVKHYGSVLDLLARAGNFRRVENMITKMSVQADRTIWLCLLGACHTHGNAELAKHAFHHAVELEPKQAAAYVIMSNIYANMRLQV